MRTGRVVWGETLTWRNSALARRNLLPISVCSSMRSSILRADGASVSGLGSTTHSNKNQMRSFFTATSPKLNTISTTFQSQHPQDERNPSGDDGLSGVSYFPTTDDTLNAHLERVGPYHAGHSFLLSGYPGPWTVADVASFLHTLIVGAFARRGLELPEERVFSPDSHTIGFFRDIPRIEEGEAARAYLEGFLEGIVMKTQGIGGRISGRECYVLMSNCSEILPIIIKELQFFKAKATGTESVKMEFATEVPAELKEHDDLEKLQMEQQQREGGKEGNIPNEGGAPTAATIEEENLPAVDDFDESPVERALYGLSKMVEICPGPTVVLQNKRRVEVLQAPRRNEDSVFPVHLTRRIETGSSFYEKKMALDHMSLDRYLLSPDILMEKDAMHTKRFTKEGVDAVPEWLLSDKFEDDVGDDDDDGKEDEEEDDIEGANGGEVPQRRRGASEDRDEENLGEGEENDEDDEHLPDSGWTVQPPRRDPLVDHTSVSSRSGTKPAAHASANAMLHPYGPNYVKQRGL